MEGKNDGGDKVDEVMLPGFRFHPTDEELVGFYLRRKIQQRNLPIELIKQVDIYKYDPWDLPSLACTGEKEWYFYCPRDRKYRNSARPNRVTGAGFWKATGTDRPIYSSDGAKCIGLKKSLVFYRGRAAKGLKTDWMMHEFRLPSISDPTAPKKLFDKSFAANDSWAICRIFKKTNSMAQRALSHSWISPLPEATTAPGMFSSDNISCTTETGLPTPHFCCNTDVQPASTASFSALGIPSYRTTNTGQPKLPNFPVQNSELPTNFMFSPPDLSSGQPKSSSSDMASMFFNLSPTLIGDVGKNTETISFEGQQQQQQFNRFLINGDEEEENRKSHGLVQVNSQWGGLRSIGFPFSLSDGWKHDLPWDSPPCPSEMSTTYSPDKCYS